MDTKGLLKSQLLTYEICIHHHEMSEGQLTISTKQYCSELTHTRQMGIRQQGRGLEGKGIWMFALTNCIFYPNLFHLLSNISLLCSFNDCWDLYNYDIKITQYHKYETSTKHSEFFMSLINDLWNREVFIPRSFIVCAEQIRCNIGRLNGHMAKMRT